MHHKLPLNDERLLALREDEVAEHLLLIRAWEDVRYEEEKKFKDRVMAQMEAEKLGMGIDTDPIVEKREDEEARNIADNPIPGIKDPEWLAWEQEALDPTKDL